MKTMVKKLDRKNIDENVILEAGNILRQGGLVAFPTETVYGLGANALDEEAAKKTYAAKGRPSDNPLIVHIADMDALYEIAGEVPQAAEKLAEHFWPGPMTMIFKKLDIVPYGTTGGLDTVAVRMPSDEIARQLILAAGGYVSAPSANTSGRPSPTSAQHVIDDLDGKIEMIVDGGTVDIGLESTIVDMTVTPPMILRPGAITREMLEEVIGEIGVDKTIYGPESNLKPKAPGMKYRHYAPKAKLTIVEGTIREEIFAIRQLAYKAYRKGMQVGIIATEESVKYYTHGLVKNIGTRQDEETVARNLYSVLREFDEEDVAEIYSESFAIAGIGSAVMNRLEKAAGHTRIAAAPIVAEQKYRRIVILSDDDTCRGPMAAEILRNQPLAQEYTIDSRGLAVLFPEPVNRKAEAIMNNVRLMTDGHTAAAFSEEDIGESVLILAVDEEQKRKAILEYGDINNLYTLNEFAESDVSIPDPYGRTLKDYAMCREAITQVIKKITNKLNSFTKGE